MFTNRSLLRMFQVLFNVAIMLALLLGSALTVTPVHAAGITVNTTIDELNSDSDCSLREAIQAANTNAIVDACTAGSGTDIITVPAGTYTLTIAGVDDVNATGDLDITASLTINGAGAGTTIIQAGTIGYPGVANGIDRVFDVIAGSTVSISDVTIANGKCTACSGGGISNTGTLTVTNSTFSGDSADFGGGIYNNGTLTVTDSTLSANSATSLAGTGGGIYNNGTLTVTNSTFSGNSANYYGGGIFSFSTLTLTNSTFSGNSAQYGGGIYKYNGTLTVTNSTFSGNSAVGTGRGIFNREGSLHLKNTILANSTGGGDCYNDGGDTIATNTNNLIETNGLSPHMCGTPAVTADPGLGPLADNGGPTQTFAITTTSSAYNAGDNATCAAADQRGVARPQNGTCDIGAYELNVQSGPLFDVNTTEDSNDGACNTFLAGFTDCTLREAITAANTLAGADSINVPAGTYTLTILGAGENLNATGDLDITGSLTINGAGAGTTVIQAHATPGSGSDRVFHIPGAHTVGISNVTIANGVCPTCYGGGIFNDGGTLTVTNSTFSGDSADFGGGGIYTLGGMLTLTNSTFSGNSAPLGGGIFSQGTLTVTNSTFSGNSSAPGGAGGGIYNSSTLTVTNSTFSGNSAPQFSGGGIYNFGTLHLKNTILANSPSGGDCYNVSGDTIASNTSNLIETNSASPNMCGTPALSTDPGLGTLTGSPAYFPLNLGSPAIDAGDDTICAAAPVNNTSQNGLTRPQGAHCDIGAFESPISLTLRSIGADDGWILESTETSGVGGTLNAAATTFNLGDDPADKQYRAILHFDTSGLPDGAVITKVTLKIRKQGLVGVNPFTVLGGLRVDMRKPSFGAAALAIGDFQAVAGRSTVATFGATPLLNWYSAVLNAPGRNYVNKTGTTQFRLRFATDDNNNNLANTMRFFSGNAGAATRPQLIVEYFVP